MAYRSVRHCGRCRGWWSGKWIKVKKYQKTKLYFSINMGIGFGRRKERERNERKVQKKNSKGTFEGNVRMKRSRKKLEGNVG